MLLLPRLVDVANGILLIFFNRRFSRCVFNRAQPKKNKDAGIPVLSVLSRSSFAPPFARRSERNVGNGIKIGLRFVFLHAGCATASAAFPSHYALFAGDPCFSSLSAPTPLHSTLPPVQNRFLLFSAPVCEVVALKIRVRAGCKPVVIKKHIQIPSFFSLLIPFCLTRFFTTFPSPRALHFQLSPLGGFLLRHPSVSSTVLAHLYTSFGVLSVCISHTFSRNNSASHALAERLSLERGNH